MGRGPGQVRGAQGSNGRSTQTVPGVDERQNRFGFGDCHLQEIVGGRRISNRRLSHTQGQQQFAYTENRSRPQESTRDDYETVTQKKVVVRTIQSKDGKVISQTEEVRREN